LFGLTNGAKIAKKCYTISPKNFPEKFLLVFTLFESGEVNLRKALLQKELQHYLVVVGGLLE
jgi:hypothetical protein